MYSLIISWHLLDGDAVWGDASFSVFQKAMDCSFELVDTVQRFSPATRSGHIESALSCLCLVLQAKRRRTESLVGLNLIFF